MLSFTEKNTLPFAIITSIWSIVLIWSTFDSVLTTWSGPLTYCILFWCFPQFLLSNSIYLLTVTYLFHLRFCYFIGTAYDDCFSQCHMCSFSCQSLISTSLIWYYPLSSISESCRVILQIHTLMLDSSILPCIFQISHHHVDFSRTFFFLSLLKCSLVGVSLLSS